MADTQKLTELIARVPALDANGTFTGAPVDASKDMVETLVADQKNMVPALIANLKEVDDGTDYRERYLLHAATTALCTPGRDAQRESFSDIVARELKSAIPELVKGFLLRQLQLCGTKRNVPAIAELLQSEINCECAVAALVAIEDGAADVLRKALPKSKGKNKVEIANALGTLRDAASAGQIRELAASSDERLRLTASWALARIGDAKSVDQLLKNTECKGYARFEALDTCILLAETLESSGDKNGAMRIYNHLGNVCTDKAEQHIRTEARARVASK